MREVKFRAWVKSPEGWKMIPVAYLELGRPQHCEEELKCVGDDWGNEWYFDDGEVELMQFTGLHDKHGREIYEGDILKEIGLLGAIEYHAPSFKLRRNPQSKAFNDEDLFEIPNMDSEVIGNIHENPELLT